MDVIIKETGEVRELWVTGPNGTDDTDDFVGNSGGFTNRDFVYDEEREVYVCSQDAYDWWEKVISDNNRLEERIEELKERYGNDAVIDALDTVVPVDLEDYAGAVNGRLDEVFGTVTIKISKDFGDWVGIERFRWGVYEAEIKKAAREIVGNRMTIKTVFADYGDSEILVEGVWDEETRREIMDIFDRIDASDERFYEEEAESVDTSN